MDSVNVSRTIPLTTILYCKKLFPYMDSVSVDSVNVSWAISLTTILYCKTSVSGHGQCTCGQCQCEPGYTSDNYIIL